MYAAPPAPPPEPSRSVSLTLSPIHLFLPVFEATLEVRPTDHLGLAVIGGYGSVTLESSLGDSTSFTVYEIGGQVIGYPLDAFESLQLGAEFIYVHVSSDELNDSTTSGVGLGYAVGPLVGYKLMTNGGFTFVVQGGIQYFHAEAQAEDSSGNSAEADDRDFIPLLNLNLGWSF
jgi:hypothetical protein